MSWCLLVVGFEGVVFSLFSCALHTGLPTPSSGRGSHPRLPTRAGPFPGGATGLRGSVPRRNRMEVGDVSQGCWEMAWPPREGKGMGAEPILSGETSILSNTLPDRFPLGLGLH